MPTITNETVPGAATQGANSSATNANQPPRRTDAVGVEIPVVVHASRSSASAKGVAKPLPAVHEETRTVIVFPQGAVVRLTAEVTAGELIVLTNQRSGADVLCRVASIKAQPGIQNYVDLEFTQRAPGFWGDSVSAAPQPAATAPATVPSAVVPAPVNKPVASQPVAVPTPVPHPVPTIHSVPVSRMVAEPVVSQPAPADAPEHEREETPAWASPLSSSAPSVRPSQKEEAQAWAQRIEPQLQTESSSSSSKTWLIGVAAAVLLGIVGGGYMLLRGHAPVQTAQTTAAVQNAPSQQTGTPVVSSPQVDVSVVSAVQPTTPAGATLQPAVISSESAAGRPAGQPVVRTARQAPVPKGVATGKISAPMPRTTVASSAEPPPMLPAGAGASAIGSGLLVNTETASAPSLPGASVASPAAGGHFEEPKLVSSQPPAYPAVARAQHIQGDVVVDVLVDGTGHVSVAKVISGNGLLQQAALNAARGWIYQPARLDGEPRATHVQVKITFRLP